MLRLARRLWENADGAIAPMVALSLVGLIAAGGLAFDYARLAAMDTELQQAADQAALAAATQLDRADDSQTRATTAIQDPDDTHRLARNITRFADQSSGASVEIASITFCPRPRTTRSAASAARWRSTPSRRWRRCRPSRSATCARRSATW